MAAQEERPARRDLLGDEDEAFVIEDDDTPPGDKGPLQ
jgi:hypothetical protein